MKPWLNLLAMAALILGSCDAPPGQVQEAEESSCLSPSMLISPEVLYERLGSADLAIIDVGKAEDFEGGHIAGAVRVWRPDYAAAVGYEYTGMRGDTGIVASLMRRCGVKPGDDIVLYDRRGDVDAARLLWLLRLYGKENVQLLDGGMHAWQARGYPIVQGMEEEAVAGNFRFPDLPEPKVILKEDVMTAIGRKGWIILDTRTTAEHEGRVTKEGAFRPGHIPGSIHLDWMEMVHHEDDYRFLTCDEIAPRLAELGITPEHKIITYCHSGVRSAHMAFVLTEIMGYPHVWNYDGSWTEWSFFRELPAVVTAAESDPTNT